VAGVIATKLALKEQQAKTVRAHKAESPVRRRVQASLGRLDHRVKCQLPKKLNFQIRRAKARWQAQKLPMPRWCVSRKLATRVQLLPTLL
jgi:hypothetical protein